MNQYLFRLSTFSLVMMAGMPLAASDSLNPVVVSKSQGLKSDQVYSQPRSFENTTQTFTQEDFETLPVKNALEMADYATGTYIQEQGRKYPISAKVRAGSRLGIIIDGAYVPNYMASKMLLQIPVSAIESMKVIRDSSALNLGPLVPVTGGNTNSRIEGFLVVNTLGVFHPTKTQLHGRLGSYGELGLDGTTALKLSEEVGARVAYGHQRQDGRSGFNMGKNQQAAFAKFQGVHQKWDWQVNLFRSEGRREIRRNQDSDNRQHDSKWAFDPMVNHMVSGQAGYYWDQTHTTATRFSYVESATDMEKEDYFDPTYFEVEKVREEFFSYDLNHAVSVGKNELRAGYQFMAYDNPTGRLYYAGTPRKEHTTSFYLQNEYAADDWSVDFGVRNDSRTIEQGYEPVGAGRRADKRLVEDVTLKDLLSGALGASWQPTELDLLTFRWLYSEQQPFGVYTANTDDLGKEKRHRYELGWSRDWLPLLTTTLTGFREDLDDAAYVADQVDDPNSADPDDEINLYDNASWTNQGVEVAVSGQKNDFRYQLSYTRTDPGVNPGGSVNLPEDLVKARFFYTPGVWETNLGVRYMSQIMSKNYGFDQPIEAGDYVVVDAQVGRTFNWQGHKNHLALWGKNLTDQHYDTVAGYIDEGLTVGLDYRVKF